MRKISSDDYISSCLEKVSPGDNSPFPHMIGSIYFNKMYNDLDKAMKEATSDRERLFTIFYFETEDEEKSFEKADSFIETHDMSQYDFTTYYDDNPHIPTKEAVYDFRTAGLKISEMKELASVKAEEVYNEYGWRGLQVLLSREGIPVWKYWNLHRDVERFIGSELENHSDYEKRLIKMYIKDEAEKIIGVDLAQIKEKHMYYDFFTKYIMDYGYCRGLKRSGASCETVKNELRKLYERYDQKYRLDRLDNISDEMSLYKEMKDIEDEIDELLNVQDGLFTHYDGYGNLVWNI